MFSSEQNEQLKAKLAPSAVKSRQQGGSKVSYVEGWHVIAEANRIFGFDKWTRETLDIKCVSESAREIGAQKNPGWGVTYITKVRVIVDGVAREGCGAGHGIDRDLGQAHESAIKEAETDAMKRAFMTFGNVFGLALYDKKQENVGEPESVINEAMTKRMEYVHECGEAIAAFTDIEKLKAWWEGQGDARRAHKLDPQQVNALKTAVMNRRDALTVKEAA
ncbi:MAG: RAD52 family DNA repair protein [Hyphomicrobiales bacterium]|nr:RAD52 family DNA repair protein [Hyphomicrobiales bacterium]